MEGKKFPGFHHYKGKIQKKGNHFSFRISCNKDTPHRLFIRRKKESIPIKQIPDFGMNQFFEVLEWMVQNFDILDCIKTND